MPQTAFHLLSAGFPTRFNQDRGDFQGKKPEQSRAVSALSRLYLGFVSALMDESGWKAVRLPPENGQRPQNRRARLFHKDNTTFPECQVSRPFFLERHTHSHTPMRGGDGQNIGKTPTHDKTATGISQARKADDLTPE